MQSRVVLVSILDPTGARGLVAEATAAEAFGAQVIPITTAILSQGDGRDQLDPVPARKVAHALREALSEPVDALLVGTLPSYWHVRAVVGALGETLPETLVLVPQSPCDDMAGLSGRARSLLVSRILPETTLALIGQQAFASLLPQHRKASPEQQAQALLDAGALGAWLADGDECCRSVDFLATGSWSGLLDYPPVQNPNLGAAAGALAALLGSGMPLREAVQVAHRHAHGLGNELYAAVHN